MSPLSHDVGNERMKQWRVDMFKDHLTFQIPRNYTYVYDDLLRMVKLMGPQSDTHNHTQRTCLNHTLIPLPCICAWHSIDQKLCTRCFHILRLPCPILAPSRLRCFSGRETRAAVQGETYPWRTDEGGVPVMETSQDTWSENEGYHNIYLHILYMYI